MAKETSKDVKPKEVAQKGAAPLEAVQKQESAFVQEAEKRKKTKESSQESLYPAGELAANAKNIFGFRQECVAAALKAAGKTAYTLSEAKEIVNEFLKKEVL